MVTALPARPVEWSELYATLPGFRSRHLGRKVATACFCAFALLTGLLLPLFGVGLLVGMLLVFDIWGMRTRTPLLRSSKWHRAAAGWLLLVVAWCVLTPAAGLVAIPLAIASMAGGMWILSGAEAGRSLRRRCARALVWWAVPPVGITLWGILPSRGWYRVWHILCAAIWLSLFVDTVAALWLNGNPDGQHFPAWNWLAAGKFAWRDVVAGILAFATAMVLRWVIRTTPSALSPAAMLPRPRLRDMRWRSVFAALASVLVWLAIALLAEGPWILADTRHADWVNLAAGAVAATPIAVVSFRSLLALCERCVRGQTERLASIAAPALGSAVLLAMVVTFAGVTVACLPSPFNWLASSLSIGLAVGLAPGIAERSGLGTRWVIGGGAVAVTLFIAVLISYLFLVVDMKIGADGNGLGLNDWAVVDPDWLTRPPLALAGLALGVVAGRRLLDPGLAAFGAAADYLHRLHRPLVGFAAGYAFIIMLFAAINFALYTGDPGSFQNADLHRALRPGDAGLPDFLFYSVNTITPLGYSFIHPTAGRHHIELLSAVELMVGVAWIVVIFAAMLNSGASRRRRSSGAERRSQPATPFE
jgi:hypothetical protein